MSTEMVKVRELLWRLRYSVDAGPIEDDTAWRYLIIEKTGDENFWALVDSITENGWTTPICVHLDYNETGWTMGNGHHRLIAAILLGLDEVPVFFACRDTRDSDYMCEDITTGDGHDSAIWMGMVDVDDTLYEALVDAYA